ncbi:hypothetical protein NEDG_01925 [Nematocida displodere]|uniref:Uncharacterized protein n=1 Tax=Nematocida displodere TaxID=1805483 RepID=A0A177EHP3_9MICR|nr:hypothetical protein NEDG_01925 [Nematocida displodere]
MKKLALLTLSQILFVSQISRPKIFVCAFFNNTTASKPNNGLSSHEVQNKSKGQESSKDFSFFGNKYKSNSYKAKDSHIEKFQGSKPPGGFGHGGSYKHGKGLNYPNYNGSGSGMGMSMRTGSGMGTSMGTSMGSGMGMIPTSGGIGTGPGIGPNQMGGVGYTGAAQGSPGEVLGIGEVPGGSGTGSGMGGDPGAGMGVTDSPSVNTLQISDLRDGISAANVLGNYYEVLLNRRGFLEGIKPISNIMVYPHENGEFTDYWGNLKFTYDTGGVLRDKTGYFEGYKVGSKEEIPQLGQLTEIGFYQTAPIPKNDKDSNYITMRMLIDEISKGTNKPIETLHNENIGIGFMDGILEYFKNQQKAHKKKKSCLSVCICQDSACKLPCKSVKCIEPMYIV